MTKPPEAPVILNGRIRERLDDILLFLDCNNAILGIQTWALKKYGNEKVLKIIKQYIYEIRKIIS